MYSALISRLITVTALSNYQQFYAVGYIIMITFNIGSHTGRHFVEHAHEGRLPYLLSLPISRWKLFLSVMLEGTAELSLLLVVPLSVTLLIIGNFTVLSIISVILTLFCLGFGVSGIMLALSFIAFRSTDIYTAIVTALSTLIIRFSTVFYPLMFLPASYATAATFSPLTYGSDLVRLILGFDPSVLVNPSIAIAVLTALTISTLGISAFLLQRLVEGVKSA
jgi:ABC-type polysaccharide/polyol phosphate export permease